MVLDEDIDQEQDSVTSRLGRITLCFVLCEIILRQVFSPCFTTMVSLVLVILCPLKIASLCTMTYNMYFLCTEIHRAIRESK